MGETAPLTTHPFSLSPFIPTPIDTKECQPFLGWRILPPLGEEQDESGLPIRKYNLIRLIKGKEQGHRTSGLITSSHTQKDRHLL